MLLGWNVVINSKYQPLGSEASVDVLFNTCGASVKVARQVLHLKDTTEAAGTFFLSMPESTAPVISIGGESFLARETPEWVCGLENVARASRHMGSKWMKPPF